MGSWQVEEAKRQLSRVIQLAGTEGPQVLTRNGKEVAVVLAIDDYRRLTSDAGAFKRFLEEAPDLAALEIERPRGVRSGRRVVIPRTYRPGEEQHQPLIVGNARERNCADTWRSRVSARGRRSG